MPSPAGKTHCVGAGAYIDAGADIVFVDGIKTVEDLNSYARDLEAIPRMYNGDLLPTQDVAALGYRLMICGSTIWLVYKQVFESFQELRRTGKVDPDRYGNRWQVADLLGLQEIYDLERECGVSQIPTS